MALEFFNGASYVTFCDVSHGFSCGASHLLLNCCWGGAVALVMVLLNIIWHYSMLLVVARVLIIRPLFLFLFLLLVMCNDACGVPLMVMLQLVVVLVTLFIPHTILFNVFARGDLPPPFGVLVFHFCLCVGCECGWCNNACYMVCKLITL